MAKTLYYGQPVSASPLNRGLMSRWKVVPWYFGGPRFADLVRGSKSPSDGTLNGPTWSGNSPRSGYGSLLFDGTNDSITTPIGANASATAVTASIWIYRAGTEASFPVPFSTQNAAENFDGWEFLLYSGSTLRWQIDRFSVADAASVIQTGAWYHICGTFLRPDMVLYVNGVSVATASHDYDFQPTANGPVFGNRVDNDADRWFGGYLDDGCVWDRALSAAEVKQLYQDQLRGSPETLNWISTRAYGFDTGAAPAATYHNLMLLGVGG